MNHSPLLARIRRAWEEGGLRALGRGLAERVWRQNSAIWHERKLEGDLPHPSAQMPLGIVLEDASGTVAWLRTRPHDPIELSLALAEGHLIARAEVNAQPVAYLKVGWGEVWVSDYQCGIKFPERAAFIYDTYVDSALRRRRVGSRLVAAVMHELKRRGFSRVYCHIPRHNIASRRLYESLGFAPRKQILFLRLLGARIFCPHPRVLWEPMSCHAGRQLVRDSK